MYRTLDCGWSDDPDVRQLPPLGMLLFVYLISNRLSHVSGIYYIPDAMIEYAIKIPQRSLDTLWHTLSELRLAFRERETGVVFVRSMMKIQGRGEKNHRAAANHLGTLHKSRLINDFLAEYPEVRRYVSDTLLDTLSGVGENVSPDPVPDIASASSSSLLPELATVDTPPARARRPHNAAAEVRAARRVPPDWLAVEVPPELATSEAFTAAWATLLQARAEKPKREQPTPTQLACQLGKLVRRAAAKGVADAVAAVEKATERGWRGVDFDDGRGGAPNGNGRGRTAPAHAIEPPLTPQPEIPHGRIRRTVVS